MWGQGGTPARQTESTPYFPLWLVDNVDDQPSAGWWERGSEQDSRMSLPHGHHQLRESESESDTVAWRGETGRTLEKQRWQWK